MPTTASPIYSRVPPESRHKLAAPIDAGMVGALRAMLTGGLARPAVPDDIAAGLIAAGYAHDTFGGLALTDIGQVRAMMENGQ